MITFATRLTALVASILLAACVCDVSAAEMAAFVGNISTATIQQGSVSASEKVDRPGSYCNFAYDEYWRDGFNSLHRRMFDRALNELEAALKSLRQNHGSADLLERTKLGIAEAYLGLEQFGHALPLFNEVLVHADELKDKPLALEALSDAAECCSAMHDFRRADSFCQRALAIGHELTNVDVARAKAVLGDIASASGLHSSAQAYYKQALAIFDQTAANSYEQALTQYKLATELHEQAADQAQNLFAASFRTTDEYCRLNMPISLAPRVVVRWEPTSPRSRVVADPIYPLKYVLVDGLRIAATPVRSENLIAVIVSLANCGPKRMQLAIGPVSLKQLSPKQKSFVHVAPGNLDIPLEEQHVTELTWRRPWLNHIQKTRVIPGYLKNGLLQLDNLFGNNQFDEYGNWPTLACNETPIVTREQFLYGRERPHDIATENFLCQSADGYRHTCLDVGEAKTGLVYFLRERYDKLELSVNIGNVIVRIPFDDTSRLQGY